MDNRGIHVKNSRSNRRIFHWVIAVAFFSLVVTGLIIYTPAFAALAAGSWTRLIHRIAAVILVGAPIIYTLLNLGSARQWFKEAAVWNRKAYIAPYFINNWRRRHKLILSVGFVVVALTGMIQWFLKGLVPSSVFNISLFIHDIAFFSAIIVLLYHVYFEFFWWYWKRRYCRQCSLAYCASVCPVGAVTSRRDSTIERDLQKCNNCRLCMEDCRRNNYYKIAIQPKKATQMMQTNPRHQ